MRTNICRLANHLQSSREKFLVSLRHSLFETDRFPRQAQDKHRENPNASFQFFQSFVEE
jgi:hypothetical protein